MNPPRPAPWIAGLAALALLGCVDADPDPRAPPAADAGPDTAIEPDAAAPDAAPDGSPDAAPGPRCAPVTAPDVLAPPTLTERVACPEGDAVRLVADPGARVRARLIARDGPLVAELWWPGGLRVERLDLDGDAELSWIGPPAGAELRVFGAGGWQLAATAEVTPTAPLRVRGRIDGWVRAVDDDGLAPPAPFSTAGARVDLVDDAGAWVVVGRVADDGVFDLAADAPAGSMTLRLVAEAEALGVPIRVGPDGRLPWAEPVASVEGSAEVAAALDPEGPTAAAWFIARTAADALLRLGPLLPPGLPGPTTPPVRYRWRPGFAEPCGSCFRPGAEPLIELSGRISDPDEWDAPVIVHELGHSVAAAFSRDDSGGGPHDGSRIDPAIAWSEGFATFFAAWPDAPVQRDYKLAGVALLDLETLDAPEASGTDDGTATGLVSEWLVAALLWDLHDGPPADDDPVALDDGRLFGPLFGALRGVWVDRGAPGVDLVDYLDALWCAEAPAGGAALLEARAVPYAPQCRAKSAGPLATRRLPDGRIEVRPAVAGWLGGLEAPTRLAAGQRVVVEPAAGLVFHFAGGRAVVPLVEPAAAPLPIERRAGAWQRAPLSARRTP